MTTFDKILKEKAIAVIRSTQPFEALPFIEAIVEGGIVCIEVTMSTPNALNIIKELKAEFGDNIVLGSGSVIDVDTANQTIDVGVSFVVTPIAHTGIIAHVKQQGLPVFAGAMTPTEIVTCHDAGADLVKIFPASLGGIKHFKTLRAPFPHIPMMPTGGVTLDNAGEWIEVGAKAVGLGNALLNDEIILNKDYSELQSRASTIIQSINDVS